MKQQILREITPLTKRDCFLIADRVKTTFTFPFHFHDEYELNFIENAKDAQRVVGDHIENIGNVELVLLGPNIPHGWFDHEMKAKKIREVTIQFHRDLFAENFLQRNQLALIRNMLEKSVRGILFSQETIKLIQPRINKLTQKQGFDSVLDFMSILHDLSLSRNMRLLSNLPPSNAKKINYNNERIENAIDYMDKNYDKPISLTEVAALNNMEESAFSRYFKRHTGMTYIESITERRLGYASRQLIESDYSIAEIAYKCGFNNISNFNRIFKKKKGCTPKEFRENYNPSSRIFI